MMDYQNTKNIVEKHYSSRLSMHKATNVSYLDGKPFSIAQFRDLVLQEQGITLDNDKYIRESVDLCAGKRLFSPIEDYLRQCRAEHPRLTYDRAKKVLDQVSSEILHVDSELEKTYLTKTLVAAVKRVYQPGCQHDTVLVLRSDEQGLGKTSFFTELAGSDWFTSLTFKNYDKDEIMICHSKWMIELGECEATIKPYTMSKLKSFITKREDTFRKPYGKESQTSKRQFILVGTTNQAKFLQDDTGNRRFWVIDISQQIDIRTLKKHRDLIWAAAVVAYENKHSTYLNKVEQELSNRANDRKYMQEDAWAELIEQWVLNRTEKFTLRDVFIHAIGKEAKSWTRTDETRVKTILRNLGYQPPEKTSRVNNIAGKYYSLPSVNCTNSSSTVPK